MFIRANFDRMNNYSNNTDLLKIKIKKLTLNCDTFTCTSIRIFNSFYNQFNCKIYKFRTLKSLRAKVRKLNGY